MKKVIRLTESDLHRIVKESVTRILKEDSSYDDNEFYDDNIDNLIINCQGLKASEKHALIKILRLSADYCTLDLVSTVQESGSFNEFISQIEEYFPDGDLDSLLPDDWTWEDFYYSILHVLNDSRDFSDNINYEDYENQIQ